MDLNKKQALGTQGQNNHNKSPSVNTNLEHYFSFLCVGKPRGRRESLERAVSKTAPACQCVCLCTCASEGGLRSAEEENARGIVIRVMMRRGRGVLFVQLALGMLKHIAP